MGYVVALFPPALIAFLMLLADYMGIGGLTRTKKKIGFWSCGLAAVLLIAFQAYKNNRTQDTLLKHVSQIEKNTERGAIGRSAEKVVQRPIGVVEPPAGGRPPRYGNPQIGITVVPPYDEEGGPIVLSDIQGVVSGIHDFSGLCVVLFTQIQNRTWFVQPRQDAPCTVASTDLKWGNKTHLGQRYAALLVTRGFAPPAPTDILPTPEMDSAVLALAVKEGRR